MGRTLKKAGFGMGPLLDRLHRYLYRNQRRNDPDEIDMIIVTGDGVIVNDTYYDKERVSELVEQALDTDDKRGGPVTVKNGGMLCRIPEIGDAILHADRSIEIGGIEIQRQSWLYQEIEKLFLS
nr:hypothetical protein [uncultured Sellimonas sp.]